MNYTFDAFVKSSLPSVVLNMPSCLDVVVNTAHKRCFENVEIPVAATAQDVIEAVGKVSVPTEDTVCYCDKIETPLALTRSECGFEKAMDTILKQKHSNWFSFVELRLQSKNGCRRYNIDEAFTRTVATDRGNVLVVSHADLRGLEVSVTNVKAETLAPQKLSSTVFLHGRKHLGPIEAQIPRDIDYGAFDEQLAKAIDNINSNNVSEIKRHILESLSKIEGVDYDPIRAFVHSLFRDYSGNVAILKERLSVVKEGVYDAPFLMQNVLPAILPFLGIDSPDNRGRLVTAEEDAVMNEENEYNNFLPEVETSRLKRLLNNVAFERMLPELLKTDSDKYVALWDGEVVDRDANELDLVVRASKKYRGAYLLIRKVVSKEESKHAHIETPTFERE